MQERGCCNRLAAGARVELRTMAIPFCRSLSLLGLVLLVGLGDSAAFAEEPAGSRFQPKPQGGR